ncbi:tetratricopeptide repeat protein [Actinomadura sp. NTSP31]|uniref:AfsR/SARP family transcriptional regulator n=1 Tax=Actinomadura sp. NTSP31 TaxID=1735447 RepID=UPI0035BFE91F
MEFRVLGQVELWARGQRHDPGWAKERLVLAVLLLNAGRPVATETLIDRLWDERPPARARALLHSQVTRLRRRLQALDGDIRLPHRSGAYTLEADPATIDYHRFRELCAQARSIAASGDPEHAITLLREAGTLWRGVPLGGVDGSWAELSRNAIQRELLGGVLDRLALELGQDRHAEVLAELDDLTTRFPEDDKCTELLMLALHRCGRTGDAVRAFERLRERLDERLGVAPGADVRDLHRRIMAADPELTRAAPRPRSARPPNDLPGDLHTFTGREAELARLTELAGEDGTAVTVLAVDGMPGVGKTVLAVRLAHRLAARYPDGRIFLPLHAHDAAQDPLGPASALERLLLAFGVHEDRFRPTLDEQSALWRSELAGRRVLLVLDDASGHEQIRPLLPGTPGSLVVVTSRHRLAGLEGARPLSLDVPGTDDAAELLARAAGGRAAPGDPGVRAVVRLCGRLPLALRLAGARLLHRPGWSAADLAERLGEGRDPLTEIRAEDRELTAVFRLSYTCLPDPDREAFRLLGLHPGADITAADTAALLGTGRARAEAVLETLLDHHLITGPRPGRYRFHDLVREYAARLAADDPPAGHAAAVDRVLDHYLGRAERAERLLGAQRDGPADDGAPEPPLDSADGARRRLAAETGDLVRAALCAADTGRERAAASFAAILAPLLEAAGQWGDATRLQERMAEAARGGGDEAGLVRALTELSRLLWRAGDHDRALVAADEGLRIARARDDRRAAAALLDQLGLVHWHRSEFDVALGYYEQALAGYRAEAHAGGEAEVLNHLGIVLWHLGRYTEAAERMNAALDLYQDIGDARGRQIMLNNIGDIEAGAGRYDAALRHYLDAAGIREMNRQHQAIWLNNVATVHRETGRADEAIGRYREALAIYREIGDRRGECDSLNNIGACFAQLGRDGEAAVHHRQALGLARELYERFEEARALHGLGETHLRAGRAAVARAHFEGSLALARAMADAYQEARALDGLGEVAARTRGPAHAEAHRRKALELYEVLGVPEADVLRARLLDSGDASEG